MNRSISRRIIPVALIAMFAAGCASKDVPMADLDQRIEEQEKQIEELETKVASEAAARQEAEDAARRAREEAKRLSSAPAATGSSGSAEMSGASLLPPSATPGECFARVLVPPVYETRTEQVLLRDAAERIEVKQPKFDWAEEKVQTKEASYKLEVVPSTYEWVEERVLVKPARNELRVVPAGYDTVTEEVLVSPERTYWKGGRGPVEKVDNATGEIMCLVTDPARYETVSKQVLRTPERVEEVELPAEYTTVKRMVVKEAATTRRVEIPAEYETVNVLEQKAGPDQVRHEIPAEYGAVTKQVMARESYLEWRPIICETNMTGDFVLRLQRALDAAGHSPGPIDGRYGPLTDRAVRAFQTEQSLATGALTQKTVEKLGISL